MKKLALIFLSSLMFSTAVCPTAALSQQIKNPDPIVIAPVLVSILRMPNWVALSEGIYKKNGLNITQCVLASDVRDLKRILGVEAPEEFRCKGTNPWSPITIGGGLPGTFMSSFQTGTPQPRKMILATIQNRSNYIMIARKDITRPEQMRGKTIGVTGFYNIMGFQALLFSQAMGLEPGKDITIIQEPTGTMEGMLDGKYDAYICGEGLPQYQAIKAGLNPLIDFKQWKVPMTSSSVNVDVEWLKNNRDSARRFVKSMIEAIALMKQDKRVVYRAMAKYYGIKDPKVADYFLGTWDIPAKPYPDREGLKVAQKLYASFPGLRNDDLKKANVDDFVDDSFVRELDESGYIDGLYKKKK